MSDWTARIDALLAEPAPTASTHGSPSLVVKATALYYQRRLALAAERLREPHDILCGIGMACDDDGTVAPCTCGKDADLARILEGK